MESNQEVKWWMRLRQLRAKAGLTQEQAALKAGIGKRTWERYEQGESVPLPLYQDAIADAFGMDKNELFGKEPQTRI